MINLIQPITIQQAYEGITHSQWWASWNWWWRMVDDDEDRRSPSPEPRTNSGSGLPMKNRRWWWLCIVKRDETFSLIFSPKIGIYSGGIRVSGATRWGQPTRARRGGLARPGGCCSPWPPSSTDFGSNNSHIFWNTSPKSFVQFWELLFLHKNNTMVVLLKTASVRVSFIQIMQIRVQNKSQSVWKSSYDGDVSIPPSLTHCLSSSNSVDKLKVIKKNFYELFCSCIRI